MKHIKSMMENVRKGEGGFTLIELLIVILILGIIAAVVVLNVGGFLGRGEKEALCTEGDTIQAAALAYAADSGTGDCTNLTGPDDLVTTDPPILLRTPKYSWDIADNCVVNGTSPNYAYPDDCGP